MRIYADLARVRMALTRCPRALQGTNGRHLGIPPNGRRWGRRPLDGDGQGHPLTTRRFQIWRGTTGCGTRCCEDSERVDDAG